MNYPFIAVLIIFLFALMLGLYAFVVAVSKNQILKTDLDDQKALTDDMQDEIDDLNDQLEVKSTNDLAPTLAETKLHLNKTLADLVVCQTDLSILEDRATNYLQMYEQLKDKVDRHIEDHPEFSDYFRSNPAPDDNEEVSASDEPQVD